MKYIVMTSTDDSIMEYDYFDTLKEACNHTAKFLENNHKILNKIYESYGGAYIFSVNDEILKKYREQEDSEIV